ncbi:hypothetical protein RLQ96_000816 [Salmonella enterica subsp. enterica serovar Muenchen]|nr:hypothetical protein [Salmonella enterica subsp. enterica serovar Muenchen]
MRLGGYSRTGLLIFLASLVVAPAIYVSYAHANPIILGMARLFGGVIGRRALTMEAEKVAEGVYVASLERATAQSLAATVRARVANIAANSSLRLKGVGTWGSLALNAGIMSLGDLQSAFKSGTLSFKTDGVAVGNGKYKVNLGNGETRIVDFNPSPDSPVFVYKPLSTGPDLKPLTGVQTGYSVPDNALFSVKDNDTNLYYFGQKSPDVAVSIAKVDIPRRYQDTVMTADGDNAKFEYVSRSHTLDIHFLETAEKGTEYPANVPGYEGVAGIPSYYMETVEAKIETKTLRSDFKACKSVYVTDIQNDRPVTLSKYYCEPPKPTDYVITESNETRQYMVITNTRYKPVNQIYAGTLDDLLSKADLNTRLDNALVAKLINALLMEAATKEGYKGVPFSSSKPVTPSEVDSLLKQMNMTLTYADLFREADTDEKNYVINNTNVDVDIDTGTDIDLGDNPDIKPPELDEPPTGEQILKPVIELMPFVKDVNIATKDVQCPIWSFELWDKKYSVDSHCTLLEKIRPLLKAVFLLIWGVISLRIILTA